MNRNPTRRCSKIAQAYLPCRIITYPRETIRNSTLIIFYDVNNIVAVEAKLCKRHYMLREGATSASLLQIRRNYANAGGTLLVDGRIEVFDDTRVNGELIWGKITKGGAERWFEVYPMDDGGDCWIITVEKQTM